jgi:hypothetical protein
LQDAQDRAVNLVELRRLFDDIPASRAGRHGKLRLGRELKCRTFQFGRAAEPADQARLALIKVETRFKHLLLVGFARRQGATASPLPTRRSTAKDFLRAPQN